MEPYDANGSADITNVIPQGLLETPLNPPEKNVGESQMAEFATSIDEIMPGPGQMMQDEIMGPPISGNKKTSRKSDDDGDSKSSKNPFGLTDEQMYAAIAGISAIITFSKPVQSRLSSMVPKFLAEGTTDLSLTGMLVSALVAALVFYFARQLVAEKS